MLIDLHVHSHLTRGCSLDPKAILTRAETHGLDARSKVKVFVGLELATDRGQYLCFFPDPMKAPPRPRSQTARGSASPRSRWVPRARRRARAGRAPQTSITSFSFFAISWSTSV